MTPPARRSLKRGTGVQFRKSGLPGAVSQIRPIENQQLASGQKQSREYVVQAWDPDGGAGRVLRTTNPDEAARVYVQTRDECRGRGLMVTLSYQGGPEALARSGYRHRLAPQRRTP